MVFNLPYPFLPRSVHDVGDVGGGVLSFNHDLMSFLPLFILYIHILLLVNSSYSVFDAESEIDPPSAALA